MVSALAWPLVPDEKCSRAGAPRAALASRLNGFRFGAPLHPDTAGFSPDQRLHTPAEFGRVFAEPARSSDRFFTVLARPTGRSAARLGLTVARRVAKRAVDRNKLKRARPRILSPATGVTAVGLRCPRTRGRRPCGAARATRESRPTLRAADEDRPLQQGSMDNIRVFLWLTLLGMVWLTYTAWVADYGASPAHQRRPALHRPRRRAASRRPTCRA